jgi:hypothetical protein
MSPQRRLLAKRTYRHVERGLGPRNIRSVDIIRLVRKRLKGKRKRCSVVTPRGLLSGQVGEEKGLRNKSLIERP